MTKVCIKCLETLPLEAFYDRPRYKDNKSSICKTCERARVKAWAQTDKGRRSARRAKKKYAESEAGKRKRREWLSRPDVKNKQLNRRRELSRTQAGRYKSFEKQLQRFYKIDVEDWAHMFNNQGGKCAACQEPLPWINTST